MATNAAYYEGLQYANKDVENVDFGGLALGIAQVEREKFERRERERREREQFELNIYDKYGDVIYPAFDKTGLEQADIYATGLGQMISARSEDLNDRFNNNEISKVQYTREMAKLKGQAQQFKSNFDLINTYMSKYQELGDKRDPSMEDSVDMLTNLFKDAKPYLNEDNLIGNFSVSEDKDGNPRVESFLWDKIASRLEVSEKYDQFEIPKQILGVQGELSKFIAEDAIKKTHLTEDGRLKEGTSNLIKEQIGTLTSNQLVSYARQAGIDYEWDESDITKVANRDDLEKEIIKDQEEKTLALLQQKDAFDEVEKMELDIKLRDSYTRQKKLTAGQQKERGYSYAYYKEENAQKAGIGLTGDVEEFTVTKDLNLKTIPFKEVFAVGNMSADAIESGQIKQLHRNGRGEYMLTVGYLEEQRIVNEDNEAETIKIPQVLRVPLTNRTQKNYFLSQLGLQTISDPLPKKEEGKKRKAY